jgi:hypothetical protein|tara:strand:- start:1 stop:165 length:165 start_codon:yes stop_codon:yes gene_type:complete
MMTESQQNALLKANNFNESQREEAEKFMTSIAPQFDGRFLKYYSNVGWHIPHTI